MEKMVVSTTTRFEKIESALGQIATATRNLEVQMGQLATTVNTRLDGILPSQTEKNPREHCQAVMLRSGKATKEVTTQVDDTIIETQVEEEQVMQPKPVIKPYVPPIPFPQRLQHPRLDKQHEKFLKIFRQLHINIPFADALAQMPSYVRFLKELLSKKKKINDMDSIVLTEECSAAIQRKLPPKLKDPGSFSLPCKIGHVQFTKALCDLGASVSLMPFSVYKQIGCGELKRTKISLQLADRTIKYPLGILEDVLVKVDKFYIPCDFVVLNMDEDKEVPIILGRPFLATAGTKIDVRDGKLSLNIGEEKVEFDLHKAVEHSSTDESCCMTSINKECAAEIAAMAHETHRERELQDKPPQPPNKKRIRRLLAKQIPKPPFEEGNEKRAVTNQKYSKGSKHRLQLYLAKMLKKVKAYNVADSAG